MGLFSWVKEKITGDSSKQKTEPAEAPMSKAPIMSVAPKPVDKTPSTRLETGKAVGSGSSGGTLVQTTSGEVYEAPISQEPGTTTGKPISKADTKVIKRTIGSEDNRPGFARQINPADVSTSKQEVTEYGSPIFTEAESSKLKGTNKVGYTLYASKPMSFVSGDTSQLAIREAEITSKLPYTASPYTSKGIYLSNLASMKTGELAVKESERSIQLQMTPSFEGIESRGRALAFKQYGELPTSTKGGLYAQGVALSVGKTLVGTGEFVASIPLNLGMQTIESGQKPSVSGGTKIQYGPEYPMMGAIKYAPSTPTSVSFGESPGRFAVEKITSPEAVATAGLLAGGVSTLKSQIGGKFSREGVVEFAGGLSPIRTTPGIYIPDVRDTTFKAVSFRGENTRLVFGKGSDARFISAQVRNGEKVVSFEAYESKGFAVLPSGRVEYATRLQGQTSRMTNIKTGGVVSSRAAEGRLTFEEMKGGQSIAQSRPMGEVITLSSGEKFGYRNFDNKAFLSSVGAIEKSKTQSMAGITTPEYRAVRTPTGFTYEPTGKYKFSPRIYIREVSFGSTPSVSTESFGYRAGGSKAVSGDSMQGLKEVTKIKTQGATVVPIQAPSQTFSTQAFATPSASSSLALAAVTSQRFGELSLIKSSMKSESAERLASRSGMALMSVSNLGFQTKELPKLKTIPAVASFSGLSSRQQLNVKQIAGSVSPPSIGFAAPALVSTPFISGAGFGLPTPMDRFEGSPIFTGGKSAGRYTPSFSALAGFSGVKGGEKTGLSYRPVTKEYRIGSGGLKNIFKKFKFK